MGLHYRVLSAKLSDRTYNLAQQKLFEDPFGVEDDSPSNLITLLIGANGTGKSFCLSKMAEIFRYSHDRRTGRKKPNDYSLKTTYREKESHIYSGETYGHKVLPNRVITLSHSLFDKFSPAQKSDDGYYFYIGARDSGIDNERFCTYDLLDTIQENINDGIYQLKLTELFQYLELKPTIEIGLKPRYTRQSELYHKLFSGKMSLEEIVPAFELRLSKVSGSQRNKVKALFKDEKFLIGFYDFLKRFQDKIYIESTGKEGITYTLNFGKGLDTIDIEQDLKYLTLLRKTNVLSYSFINISKENQDVKYNILDSSSGEVNMLTSFGRLIPCLQDFSLILIDEPEISLHPNWQMDYLKILRKVMGGIIGCHIIIATHSPFLVSEADSKDCIIVEAKKDRTTEFIDSSFGWTTDDILTKVFSVKSTRSFSFEKLLRELYSKMGQPKENKNRILDLIEEIGYYDLPKDDPANRMLQHALQKIKEV